MGKGSRLERMTLLEENYDCFKDSTIRLTDCELNLLKLVTIRSNLAYNFLMGSDQQDGIDAVYYIA